MALGGTRHKPRSTRMRGIIALSFEMEEADEAEEANSAWGWVDYFPPSDDVHRIKIAYSIFVSANSRC